MLALLLPFAAHAADIAQIDDTKYESIVDAVAAVQAGTPTTITMIADEDIDIAATPIVIPAGKNISLDLNGKTIIGACASGKTSAMFTNYGTFTITDSSSEASGKLVYNPNPTWTYSTVDPG